MPPFQSVLQSLQTLALPKRAIMPSSEGVSIALLLLLSAKHMPCPQLRQTSPACGQHDRLNIGSTLPDLRQFFSADNKSDVVIGSPSRLDVSPSLLVMVQSLFHAPS